MTSDEQLSEEEYQKKLNSRKKSRGFQLSPREFKGEELPFVPEKSVPQIQVLPETPVSMPVPQGTEEKKRKSKGVALALIQPEKLSKKVKKKKLVKKIKPKVNLDELQKGISELSFDDEDEEEEFEYVYEEVEEEETPAVNQPTNEIVETLSEQDYNELLLKRKQSKMKKLDLNGVTTIEEKVKQETSPLTEKQESSPLAEKETSPVVPLEKEQTPLEKKNPSISKIQETKPRNLRNSQLTDEEYQELLQMRKHLKNKKMLEGITIEKEEDTLSEEQYAEFLSRDESQQQSITDNQYEELMRLRKGLKEKKVESRRKTFLSFF
jgi:hypothetical protein